MRISPLALATLGLAQMSALAQPATVATRHAQYALQAPGKPAFSDANWVSLGVAGLTASENGAISAIAADTNGNVYVAGGFTLTDTVFATNIAKWNGAAWSALGWGIGGRSPYGSPIVRALAFDTYGTLYAGGTFTTAGGVNATNIAKWDGSEWSALGSGVGDTNGAVSALACDGSGNLYVGGCFTNAGGASVTNIARWDGVAWSSLGSGVSSNVYALAFNTNGNLYAGGCFTNAGGAGATNIAQWDGNSWSALGSGIGGADDSVSALAFDLNGNLYAGGYFTNAGGASATNVAQWNGSAWSALGSGLGDADGGVSGLVCDGSGDLYASGSFTNAGGVSANYIAQWNGAAWSPVGWGISVVDVSSDGQEESDLGASALAFDTKGNLYAGLLVAVRSAVPIYGPPLDLGYIFKWNTGTWSPLDPGINGGWVNALAFDTYGNLYAGGTFTTAGGTVANNVAQWNGSAWSALGSGLAGGGYWGIEPGIGPEVATGQNAGVNALAFDTKGNLYAGGDFTVAGGVGVNDIAQWDGSAWSALGLGAGGQRGSIWALAFDNLGNLYAGGWFSAAGEGNPVGINRWDGGAWSALGSEPDGYVYALACDTNANLYAGGYFSTAGGASVNSIAKWDGNTWSALGLGLGTPGAFSRPGSVFALAFDTNGNLYVGGQFTMAGPVNATNVAKWDGSAWSALGSGVGDANTGVSALAFDGSGNLYAGGYFTKAGAVSAASIAKWDGAAWSSLGSGVYSDVYTLAFDANGNLYVGGMFTTAGTNPAANIAKALLTGPTPNQLLLANAGDGTNVITCLGAPGANYALDLATNLAPPIDWMPQGTNTASAANAAAAGYLSFTNSNRLPQAYYRTRSAP